VIQKIGLCVCLYDLLWASEGLIGHGTGLVNVNGKFYYLGMNINFLTERKVEFRLIVFRPFKHEVLIGMISSSDQWGINSSYSCESWIR
jgi:DNA-directed RNA polymerase III subunit RPC8